MCGCNDNSMPIGPSGQDGRDGLFSGYSSDWIFDNATSNTPAPTKFRLSDTDPTFAGTGNIGSIYINVQNSNSIDVTAFLNSFTNNGSFGRIRVFDEFNSNIFYYYNITNVSIATGVCTLTVTYIDGNGSFVIGNKTVVSYVTNSITFINDYIALNKDGDNLADTTPTIISGSSFTLPSTGNYMFKVTGVASVVAGAYVYYGLYVNGVVYLWEEFISADPRNINNQQLSFSLSRKITSLVVGDVVAVYMRYVGGAEASQIQFLTNEYLKVT